MKALARLWFWLFTVKPLEDLDDEIPPQCWTCGTPLLPDGRHDFR